VSNVANVLAVARREFTVRIRTRSYQLGSVAIILGVLAFAFLPVIGRVLEGGGTKPIALYVTATNLPANPAATLSAILNSATAQGVPAAGSYVIEPVDDLAVARTGVASGKYAGALAIERSAAGELTFAYYAKDTSSVKESVTSALVQQAAQSLAVADRLARLGIEPGEQATLFAPASYEVLAADSTASGPASANFLLGFGLTVLIFMMIVLYGSWIAMSVVEEKSSRVVEVVLNAATPFQLLSGKVLGVGALAVLQYLAILCAGGVALVLQGPISRLLLGESAGVAGVGVPAGLDAGILVLLLVYGVLGFVLYSVLFAAAASLVSRQEDVNQSVMPMMLVATAGYLVAVYAGTGLLDARADWMGAVAQFPFFSPFMMLSRVTAGAAGPVEVGLSIVLLCVTIVGALWLAARIYSAGVLLYGQRPSLLRVWKLIRSGT
jgi:ABC-2 type transport system permease protein